MKVGCTYAFSSEADTKLYDYEERQNFSITG